MLRISRLTVSGIYDHWLIQSVLNLRRDRIVKSENDYDWEKLHFNKMIGLFYLWSFGIFMSIVMIVLEMIHSLKYFLIVKETRNFVLFIRP